MEPVRSLLYFKTGFKIKELVHLLTRQAEAASRGQVLPTKAKVAHFEEEKKVEAVAPRALSIDDMRGAMKASSQSFTKKSETFTARTSAAATSLVSGGGAMVRRMLSVGRANKMVAPMLASAAEVPAPVTNPGIFTKSIKMAGPPPPRRFRTEDEYAQHTDHIHRKAGHSFAAMIMRVRDVHPHVVCAHRWCMW